MVISLLWSAGTAGILVELLTDIAILLQEVLEEIEEERQKTTLPASELRYEGGDTGGIVLVACKDECSCMQLRECILESPQKVVIVIFLHAC